MPARIRFADHTKSEVEVPGSLLPLVLPDGLRIHRVRTDEGPELTLRSDRTTSKFVGRLDVPYVGSRGRVQVAHLDVPPPPPWTWGDMATMRAAADRLDLADLAGATGLRRAEDTQWRPGRDIAWSALTRCSSAARRVLVRWPSRTKSRVVRSALEQPRGSELIDATEQRLGLVIDLITAGARSAPEVTMRRVGSSVPWTNRTLAAVASRAAEALDAAEAAGVVGEVPRSLVAPIRALSQLARPRLPAADPPFSSWPSGFIDAYLACIDLLSSISIGGSKVGWVPLSDLWRLYESWLGERVLAILTRVLGAPNWIGGAADERIAVRWVADDWELELRHPCVFTDRPRALVGSDWWSVSSRLDPDVALLARTASGTSCVVLDAKDRPRLSRGDVAVEASKYQWGIRRDSASTLGVAAVVLLSPYGGDEPYDRQHARHWALHAHPNSPPGKSPGEVGMDLSSPVVRDLVETHLRLPASAFLA